MTKLVSTAYAAVMDPEVNPLRSLPKIVRFQLMTFLALMWTVVFCVWAGLAQWIGFSWAAHAVLLIGVYFTADIFRHVAHTRPVSYDMLFKDRDGCARYDDVWGG